MIKHQRLKQTHDTSQLLKNPRRTKVVRKYIILFLAFGKALVKFLFAIGDFVCVRWELGGRRRRKSTWEWEGRGGKERNAVC